MSASLPAQSRTPDVSVVVVNWNTKERLRACLSSIGVHFSRVRHEVIVVDNASDDGSAEMVASTFPFTHLIRNERNVGFARANNQAMSRATGAWFLLLNSDTELFDDSVADLLAEIDREGAGIGVVHCRHLFPDGRVQPTVYRFPSLGLTWFECLGLYKLIPARIAGEILLSGYWDYASARDVDWVAGSFMLLPREVFATTGGFDEQIFMYGEDLEWCYRIRDRGWRVRYAPSASIIHHDHASSDIMWGARPVALCFRSARDWYAKRHGCLRAAALLAGQLVGAVLRAGYYSVRTRLPVRSDPTYEIRRRDSAVSIRALVALAVGRR